VWEIWWNGTKEQRQRSIDRNFPPQDAFADGHNRVRRTRSSVSTEAHVGMINSLVDYSHRNTRKQNGMAVATSSRLCDSQASLPREEEGKQIWKVSKPEPLMLSIGSTVSLQLCKEARKRKGIEASGPYTRHIPSFRGHDQAQSKGQTPNMDL